MGKTEKASNVVAVRLLKAHTIVKHEKKQQKRDQVVCVPEEALSAPEKVIINANNDTAEKDKLMKHCSKCKIYKAIAEFSKCTSAKSGLQCSCKLCKKGMQKKCAEPGCGTVPSYGRQHRKPTHCLKHKKADMTSERTENCKLCTKRPSYGTEIGKPLYCKTHKLDTMFDVVSSKCKHKGCKKIPSYGIDKAEFCKLHKTADMMCTLNNKCKAKEKCERRAAYALPGNKATWCSTHASSGMINVISKRCSKCDKRAHCGFPGHSRTRCADHKEPGMLYLRNTCCVEDGCRNVCTHGIGYATHCGDHALPSYQNLVERHCSSCHLLQVLNSDNKCVDCDETLAQPDRVHLIKQKRLQAEFDADSEFPTYDFTDRYIKVEQEVNCTTSYRPDFLFDFATHVCIVENDETQHRGPSYDCDRVRMLNLTQQLMRPTVFVRFNCDGYKVSGRAGSTDWRTRIAELKKWVLNLTDLDELQGAVTSAVYLYYDEFEAEKAELEICLIMS
jgi:hypothetical protein